jgi:hypothetical protein
LPNAIAVIEQLTPLDGRPTFHVKRKQAEQLVDTEQASWVIPGAVIRKTHKFGRLTEDSKLMAGRAFAIRGLSAQVGEALAEGLADKAEQWWAKPMLNAIRLRREVPAEA